MSIKEFFVLMIICTIWGVHFVVMKVTVGGVAPPLFYAAIRMSLVAILVLPWLRWHKGQMRNILLGGLGFGALNYAFMFPAVGMTTASVAAITIELYVPFSIILSVLFLKERIGLPKIAGITLAFVGVAIIASAKPPQTAGPLFALGVILMVFGALSEAFGAIFVKMIKAVSPLQILAWFGLIGSAVLWPLTFIFETGQASAFASETRMAFVLALFYSTVLVSIVAHGSYYWLLGRLPVSIVASSGLMTTVIAVIASLVLLGETPTPRMALGAVMTLCGIALILWRNQQKAKAAQILPEQS